MIQMTENELEEAIYGGIKKTLDEQVTPMFNKLFGLLDNPDYLRARLAQLEETPDALIGNV